MEWCQSCFRLYCKSWFRSSLTNMCIYTRAVFSKFIYKLKLVHNFKIEIIYQLISLKIALSDKQDKKVLILIWQKIETMSLYTLIFFSAKQEMKKGLTTFGQELFCPSIVSASRVRHWQFYCTFVLQNVWNIIYINVIERG
jgi:hypothetical protein